MTQEVVGSLKEQVPLPVPSQPFTIRVTNTGNRRQRQWIDVGISPQIIDELIHDTDMQPAVRLPGGDVARLYRCGPPRGKDTSYWALLGRSAARSARLAVGRG